MFLTVVTPEKKLVTDLEVDEIFIPGHRGELNPLSMHAPLITTLNVGIIKYRPKGASNINWIATAWGYCEIDSDHVLVLAEKAEYPEELNLDEIKENIKELGRKVASGETGSSSLEEVQLKLRLANVRVRVSEHTNEYSDLHQAMTSR
jgi:F-type H+-transporting ATPase subunit epsilon